MKNLILVSSLAAVMFGASAQAPPAMSTVTIPAGPQTIELPERYSRMYDGGFETVVGTYDLSNGQVMTLSKRINRKYVRIGDGPKSEVIAAHDYDFVALDKKYRVVLQEPEFDEVRGYVLIALPTGQQSISSIGPADTGRRVAGH